MIKASKQPTGLGSTHPRAGRPISTTLPEAPDFGDQTTGGEGLHVADLEARVRRQVLPPVRENPDAPASAQTTAPRTEGFAPHLADTPLRMLVADATPASTRTPGVTASAVAGLLSRMGVE